jgi:hypothetical protein
MWRQLLAELRPGEVPSGTDGNPLQGPSAAAGSQEGSEDEHRTPETGDEGREALPASVVGEGHRRRRVTLSRDRPS